LWSDDPTLTDDHELRRLAEEVEHDLQSIKDTNRLEVAGGRPRQIRVELDPEALAARRTAPLEVAWAFDISNKLLPAGDVQVLDQNIVVEAGDFIHSAAELGKLVINVIDGVPVYLDDVARMTAWKLSAALKPANKLLSPNSDFIDTKGGTGTREAKQKSS